MCYIDKERYMLSGRGQKSRVQVDGRGGETDRGDRRGGKAAL